MIREHAGGVEGSVRLAATAAEPRDDTEPYAVAVEAVAAGLGVDATVGLSSPQAADRLDRVGPNCLTQTPPRPAWKVFLDQLRSALFVILLGAAVFAAVVGDVTDAAIIAVVIVLNALIGFLQERKATRSLAALKQMLVAVAVVRRDGELHTVPAEQIVPGDVVVLEAGARVPADGRIVAAHDAAVDQASLTGESEPVTKQAAPLPSDTALADRSNLLHAGTTLVRGRAEMVVTATAMATEMGRIAGLLDATPAPRTPLQLQLDSVGRRIALIGIVAVAAYCVVATLKGAPPADVVLRGVALAVAAVPEGLPAVLVLVLAIGVHRMSGRGAIVRRLASVETLGSATVLCTDKTGTLTRNLMTVREVVPAATALLDGAAAGAACSQADTVGVLRPMVLCNNAHLTGSQTVAGSGVGDPMEVALVVAAAEAGLDVRAVREATPRIAELPFSGVHKYMATVEQEPTGSPRLRVKGAPDVLLPRCSHVVGDGEAMLPLDKQGRLRLGGVVEGMAARGLRVLAAAERPLPADPGAQWPPARVEELVHDLVLIGFVGLADPPRPEAAEAVATCQRAGIDVKMVTGDHVVTAAAIAGELGITGRAVTGAQLESMTPEELTAQVDQIGVFARVTPAHKLAIVNALTARGHIAGMTGDGANDVAAIRAAHVGVAMGRTGTDVTKDAADLVLTDDNFATVVGAVSQGRGIYDNIVKFIRLQLTTNIAAIVTFLAAALIGLPMPMTAVQVLWVNLITDGPPALALGLDRPGRHLMQRPPRPAAERILSSTRLWRMALTASLMTAGTLAVLAAAHGEAGTAHATTLAFTTFVLFQVANALNVRAEHTSAFSRDLPANGWLFTSLAAVLALQAAVVHLPALQTLFGTVALDPIDWLLAAGIAGLALVAGEIEKAMRRRARADENLQEAPTTQG